MHPKASINAGTSAVEACLSSSRVSISRNCFESSIDFRSFSVKANASGLGPADMAADGAVSRTKEPPS